MNIFSMEFSPITWKIINSVISILIIYLLATLASQLINRKIEDIKKRYNARKTSYYVASLLTILVLSFMWIRDLNRFTVILSVFGAGLVVALQELILCIAGWFVIVFRKPFDTGDRIEIGNTKGDVIDVKFLQTSLLEIGNWVKGRSIDGQSYPYA